MADKNIVRMEEKKASGEQKFAAFLEKNRKGLLCCLCLVIVAIVAFAVYYNVSSSIIRKNLDKIEVIEYSLTKDAADLDDAAISARQETALSNLEPYVNKGGIVGARADMLAADIYTQKKDWTKARDLWTSASAKGKKSYIKSLCAFNAAAAYENLGDSDKALELYEQVSLDKNFVDRSRAYFNAGRIKEGKGDFEGAKASYEEIANLEYSNDTWNDLAKTRLLELKKDGKVN